jgi:hypothetical protein
MSLTFWRWPKNLNTIPSDISIRWIHILSDPRLQETRRVAGGLFRFLFADARIARERVVCQGLRTAAAGAAQRVESAYAGPICFDPCVAN